MVDLTSSLLGRKILVTGGAGFIGSNIAEFLLKNGVEVRVLDNLLTGFQHNIDRLNHYNGFEFLHGDITDFNTCLKAMEGIYGISHQAALGSVPRSFLSPEKTNEINVSGFVNILTAARNAGIDRFVYASSSSVYGDEYTLPKKEYLIGKALSPYAVSKYANELYASVFSKSTDMKILGLRYFNVFGPHQDPNGPYAAVIPIFIDRILKGEEFYINGDGLQTRDFTYVANAVQANILGLTAPDNAYGRVFNIAYGENYTLLDLVAILEKKIGLKARMLHRDSRDGDIRDSLADISLAREYLGYNPMYNFVQGIEETIRFFTGQ